RGLLSPGRAGADAAGNMPGGEGGHGGPGQRGGGVVGKSPPPLAGPGGPGPCASSGRGGAGLLRGLGDSRLKRGGWAGGSVDRGLVSEVVIRTPDQRLRVFVSSTLAELAEERRAVARAISAMRLTPVMFELGARPHPPQEVYRSYLAQSDVFIG